LKRILVTDTHLGCKKASDFYLELVFGLFEDIGVYAQDKGIKELVHLGDFFDNRKSMSLKTLFYANQIGLNLKRFDKSYFILGNHDLFYKDRYLPNSSQLFEHMNHIDVIYEPTKIGNCVLVPWVVEGEEGGSFGDFLQATDARFCLGHWEINGAKMNVAGTVAENSQWNFGDFRKFEKTISGHFHTKGVYNHNVEYIGSPFHMDFNDSGPRGWYVFDDETGDLEFVEWRKSPKYIKWTALPDNIVSGEFTGHVVKVIFAEDFGTTANNQIIADVQSTNPHQIFVEYAFSQGMTTGTREEETVVLMDAKDVHQHFIDKSDVPTHLNKKVMAKIVEQMYGELGG
jgi:DNA repair exonuclease SbcCD nuclease subunit